MKRLAGPSAATFYRKIEAQRVSATRAPGSVARAWPLSEVQNWIFGCIELRGGSNVDQINPFDDLSSLRLDQSFADTVGVKKLLTTVPVRKPNRQDFVRVHPDPTYRLTPAAIIEVKEDREVYLVTPEWRRNSPASSARH